MIREVTIRRFKRFEDVTFQLRGHVVLAGPNNTGKTTFLQAVAAAGFAFNQWKQLNNFRKLKAYGWPGFRRLNLWRQDKGQTACAAAFIKAIETGSPSPIPFDEIVEVTRVTIEIDRRLNNQ